MLENTKRTDFSSAEVRCKTDLVVKTSRHRFFVEALLGLAEQLGDLSPKKRAKGLQEGLERINEFFLSERAQGSDVIYVPFRGSFHQVP